MSEEGERMMEAEREAEMTACSCGIQPPHTVRQHWAWEDSYEDHKAQEAYKTWRNSPDERSEIRP